MSGKNGKNSNGNGTAAPCVNLVEALLAAKAERDKAAAELGVSQATAARSSPPVPHGTGGDDKAAASAPTRPAPLSPSADGAAPAPKEGQGPDGKFVKGNKLGLGNPHYRKMARNRTLWMENTTEADQVEIIRKFVDMAKAGDLAAAQFVMSYCVGKPTQAVDPDELDLHEWGLIQRHPSAVELVRAVLDVVPADTATELLHVLMDLQRNGGREKVFAKAKKDILGNPAASRRLSEEADARVGRGGR